MSNSAPTILMVGDASLEPCAHVLSVLDHTWSHIRSAVPGPVQWPRELLISDEEAVLGLTGASARDRGDFAWLCIVPARTVPSRIDALRAAGVHWVMRRGRDGAIDRELFRVVVLQALYCGVERRSLQRTLTTHEVAFRIDDHRSRARLLDLSSASCRILSGYAVPRGSELHLQLPDELDPEAPSVYPVQVLRTSQVLSADRRHMVSIVLGFPQDARLRAKLEYALAAHGRSPAAVLQLAPGRRDEVVLVEEERRLDPRYRYPRRIAAITRPETDNPSLVRGYEISMQGIRVEPEPDLIVGRRLLVGLYRGPGQRPFMIEATVRAEAGQGGRWLSFDRIEPGDRGELERMVVGLPRVD